jgi:hypothetical protein
MAKQICAVADGEYLGDVLSDAESRRLTDDELLKAIYEDGNQILRRPGGSYTLVYSDHGEFRRRWRCGYGGLTGKSRRA